LELFSFFLILYILSGIIGFVQDFVNRDVTSARYVTHPKMSITLFSILFWPLVPIMRLIEQRRRMSFKFIFAFYLIPLFWGSSAYGASMSGFITILSSDSETYIKGLKIIGILVFFSAVIWWLFSRNRRKVREYIDKT
jgi:hypothetical protein